MIKEWYKSRLNSGKVEKIELPKVEVVPLLSRINKSLGLAKAMKDEDLSFIASDHSDTQKDRVDDTYHKVNSPQFQDFEDAMAGKASMLKLEDDDGKSVKVKHKIRNDTYQSRPYHAKTDMHSRVLPLSGWGIITTNNLYKEAGISDLCEEAAMSSVRHEGKDIPLAVVKFNRAHDKEGVEYSEIHNPHRDEDTVKVNETNPKFDQDNRFNIDPVKARKIGLMDYLTGNYDRHAKNILVRSQPDEKGYKSLLAIDHDRSFHYNKNSPGDPHEHYLKSAMSRILKNDAAIISTPEHDGHLVDWWNDKKVAIHDEMRRSLETIKDHNLRGYINSNFQTRYKTIDQWASNYNNTNDSFFASSEERRHTPTIPLHIIDPAHVQLIEQSLPQEKDKALSILISTLKENLEIDKKETLLHIARNYGKDLTIDGTIKFLQKHDSDQDVEDLRQYIKHALLSDLNKAAAVLRSNNELPKDNQFLTVFDIKKIKTMITGT
jgi:hypothetical protein